ncbi:HAD family hydrolase [Sphingomonas sp. ID1715]|uniref:HAD family hydrolase n=1 Tax=Sphingomonas sp. ID1715 TaxID=1656898 RepID=UPI001488398D|nr:HAD family hydrolase [Sphingomonas sp. ID1715]NNM75998.1 HAD family hydrolase [Sphingomonas sp. ID1715]
MLKAALFDIDGTLIDSNDLHAQAWDDAFRRYGIELPYDRIRDQIGKGADNLLPALLSPDILETHGKELEQESKAVFKRDYLSRVKPFPGVRGLFEGLKASGALIALATSGAEDELEHHKQLLGIGDLLDAATSADDAQHSKPYPDIFQAALGKLPGIEAAQAVVVGDTPYDMEGARKAGMASVALRCGGFAAEWLAESGAAALFDGPWALPHRLDAWLD